MIERDLGSHTHKALAGFQDDIQVGLWQQPGFKSRSRQINTINEYIDYPSGIVFWDIIIEFFWKQGRMSASFARYKSLILVYFQLKVEL